MRISRALLDEVVEHAREAAPEECCGMIATRDGEAVAVFRMRNASPSPRTGYEMDGKEQYTVQMGIEDNDLELGAIYHSHPRTDAEPSQADVNLAFYPDAIYLIVGHAATEPETRAWRIVTTRDEKGRVVDAAVSSADLEVE